MSNGNRVNQANREAFILRAQVSLLERGLSVESDAWKVAETHAALAIRFKLTAVAFASWLEANAGKVAQGQFVFMAAPLKPGQRDVVNDPWTRSEIDAILAVNDQAVERGIVNLFKLQTADEKVRSQTNHSNGRGFNMTSARVGTRFARWILGMDDSNVRRYPPKSLSHPKAVQVFSRYLAGGSVMGRARSICLLHSQQLVDIANGVLTVTDEI